MTMSERQRGRRLRQLGLPLALVIASCDLHGSADEPKEASTAAPVPVKRSAPAPVSRSDGTLERMVESARTDLAGRLAAPSLQADEIEVLSAERVSWRSAALGCPMPDRAYRMVITPGVRIVLRANGKSYEYHGNPAGAPFLCEPPGRIEPPAPSSSVLDPT